MKLKILVVAILVIAGLYFANKYLNKPSSTSTPSVAQGEQPAGGDVRQSFTVGHLPVT